MTDLNKDWLTICTADDLVKDSGVCALLEKEDGDKQVAIFHLPNTENKVYAVSNYDPCGDANVLYRGIVGNIGDSIVVASPLYKQHFCLSTGKCLEEDVSIDVYQSRIVDNQVQLLV